MNKTERRHGIGWVGKLIQYTSLGYIKGSHDEQSRDYNRAMDKADQTLNKLPEFKRAAKKRQRRKDAQYHEAY